MADEWIGILLAIISGIIYYSGIIAQKKVVNELPPKEREKRFFRSLVKSRLWLLGLILSMFAPAVFTIVSQYYIGPALLPGLMSFGLIILAIGSVRINKEKLEGRDYAGILLIVVGVFFVGISGLVFNAANYDFSTSWFLVNSLLYTGLTFVLAVVLDLVQRKGVGSRAILLIFSAGFIYSLTNFWVAPLAGTIPKVFEATPTQIEWIVFLSSCIFLTVAQALSIAYQQRAYKYGKASTLNAIQQFPVQIIPPFTYLFVFGLSPPADPSPTYSLLFIFIGIALIITSSFLLAKHTEEVR